MAWKSVSDDTSLPGLCCAILDGNVELARLALEEYDISSNSAMVDALWKITIPARLRARSFDSMELERSAGKFELESTMTPLMLAVKSGSLDMVKLVLKTWLFVLGKYYGSKPEAIDAVRAGVGSAVSLAAGLARLDIVRLLGRGWRQDLPATKRDTGQGIPFIPWFSEWFGQRFSARGAG
jgi:microcompartment protein CcmK/EutM